MEDATAKLYHKNEFDPLTVKKDQVKFSDLRIFLGVIHDRYMSIRPEDFVPNRHACFKGIY